ncbi:MAG: T9SS type A sorting domain-containing protein [Candidatus Kapaibacterium sp.]|nr:MAG: T9SS type A sorting domain-containing protein [Candidatus Kapabacteria bacterium]
MNSFGSATPGSQRRSGYVVLTFLLALLLGAVTPPSLWSQISISASPGSPQCLGTSFQLQTTVTNRLVPHPSAPAGGAWAAPLAQGAGGVGNGAVNNIVLGDDQLTGEQNPQQVGGGNFIFNFYGELINLTNDGFYLSSNGFITFLNNLNTGINPADVPNAAAPNKTVILANIDLDPGAGGAIWWQVQQNANGNYLVITFNNVPYVDPFQANLFTGQLIIYENGYAGTPSRIEWRLDNVPQPGGVIGILAGFENECGTTGDAAYNDDGVAFGAVNDALYTSDPVTGAAYAHVSVAFYDGATLMGTVAASPNPPITPTSSVNYSVPVAYRGVGTHTYKAVVTYTYYGCATETAEDDMTFEVVANPATQVITNPAAPRCGDATGTASVTANGTNTYTWSAAPAAAVASFTPNGTTAAATTTIAYNNASLSPSGTSVTLTVVEALSVAPFCATTSTGVAYTVYRTPDAPVITGSGANNGGINPPALPGASGNPCAGTARTYTATAAGTAGGATHYRWQLSGAPAGTVIGGTTVTGGAADIVTSTNNVLITWGNSVTNVTATLVATASNGTGGATGVYGSPGAHRSCVGPASAATAIYINGVPAVAQVVQTVPVSVPPTAAATTVCENETRTYSVPLTAGSTYTWTVTNTSNVPVAAGPTTYTLVTGAPPNNNSATIDWNGAATYRVQCTEVTSGGCTTVHTFHTVTVNIQPQPVLSAPLPADQCTYIGGPIENGQNLAQYAYTVTVTPGKGSTTDRFDWAVTNGVFVSTALSTVTNINAVGANATQQVRWTSPGAQQVSVTQTIVATGCSKTVTQNVNVVASPTPKTITGPGYVTGIAGNPCAGTGPHTYQIGGPWPNTSTWAITVLSGGVYSVALNPATGQFGVTWNAGVTSGRIRIVETGPAPGSCATEREYAISINPQPNGTISVSPTAVCNGATATVTFNPTGSTVLPGATYLWSTTTPANVAYLGATNNPSATISLTNPGPGTVSGNVTVNVTNPGVGGCTQTFTNTISIIPNPTLAAPTVPAPICVGGSYTLTGNASAYPGGGVNRYWQFTITPTGAPYSGATTITSSWILSNAATGSWTTAVIGDSSVADILAGGTFDLTVTVKDSLAPAACVVTQTFGPNTVTARPTRPLLNLPDPQTVCDGIYPQVYTITNYIGGYTYSIVAPTSASITYGWGPGVGQISITDWGGTGARILVLRADDGTCTRDQRYDMNVVASPANPQPAPVITDATQDQVCVDSMYFATPGVVGPLAVDPTRIITYSAPTPLANHWYQWYVTNGIIITGTPGAYTSVGTNTTAALNATSAMVVWTGPTPGKVKYLVFTSDPNSPPPAPCFATSIEPTITLPIVPNVPLTLTTTSSMPGDNVCEGNTIDLILSGSKIGLSYRVEEWNGTTWNDAGIAPVAGTGAAINITVPASVLTITSSPITDHVFRITARDQAFTPDIAGPCEWLRTSVTPSITVHVFDTPNDIPVVNTTPLVCDGDNVVINVGTVGQPTQTHVMYELWRGPFGGPFAYTGISGMGNGGMLPLTDNTTTGLGNGGPLLAADNYQYEIHAYIPVAPLGPPAGGCPFTMTAKPGARIFEYPANPTVTFTPNPVCWEEEITVNLANTQAGVEYEVRANGSFLSPQVILQGTGGAVSTTFNSVLIQPTNPSGSVVIPNVEVVARLVTNVTYPRPIPPSACPIPYGTINYTVWEKPVAVVTGPATSCGPSTATYTADPVTPAPPMYFDWLITTVPPAGTTPTSATSSASGTVNPFVVNWGIHLLNCDGTYNPLAQTIRMIATNAWGCTDTAFFNLTIEPTVSDADIFGPTSSCIYGGFESHLDTFTVARPAPCVFPAGTTYLWTMPTGVVSGAIRSGQSTPTIVAEWYTTGGTNIGTVQVDVTLPPSHGGCTTTITHDVVVYPLPQPVINGPTTVCQGDMGKVYIADNYPTDTYNWQVIGGQIVGGMGTGVVGDTANISGVGLNTISVNWNDTPNPNAFIRLTQVSAAGCMNVTNFFVTVAPTPVPAISGPEKVCDNSVVTYSTADNSPNNTYNWTITAGNATIQSGNNQAQVSVLTGDIGGGNSFTIQITETVLATNCSETVSKVISILEKPNPTITRVSPAGGTVGGACLGQTVTYTTSDPVAPNPTYSYKWSVTNGTITGNDEAASIAVNWNSVGVGTITLNKWHTGSQCTTTVTQNVNVVDAPAPTISGPLTVCGLSTHTYSTPNVAGNTYAWTISANGTITGGAATNAATIQFNNPVPASTLPATISVTETNTASGCAATASISVTITDQPQIAGINRVSPAGPANTACNNSSISYGVSTYTAGAGYTFAWSVTGGTITAGNGTETITVQWTNVGTQTITVTVTNPSGDCSDTETLNVGVTYQPVPAITGNAITCTGNTEVYSTPSVPGSTYSWSLPTMGGNILSGTTSHEVTVEWILSGNRTVQVVETNGNCTATATLTVSVGKTPTSTAISRISPAPTSAVAIACVNQVITYSTPLNSGYTYLWTVTGGNFVGGVNNTNQVQIEWTTVGAQTLTVTETTPGTNCSKTVSQTVNVEDQPNPTITGPSIVCTQDVSTYSVTAVSGHNYSWTISGGGTITSSANSSSITVEWTTAGTWTVDVTQSNATGNCTATASLSVTVGATPTDTEITGAATVCYGSTTNTYSVSNVASHTYYWTVTGGTITSGQGTSSIAVQWTAIGNQTVTVVIGETGTNCEVTLVKNVSVEDQPAPSITGSAAVCTDDIVTYAVNPVAGHTYSWSVSSGGTITSGTNSHSITVEWTTAGTHTVSVTQTNGTGNCSAVATLNVSVGQTPAQTDINGPATVCQGSTQNYNVTNIAGQSYVWTVTGGTITSGAGTNSINVQWTVLGTNEVKVKISTTGTNCEKTLTLNVSVEDQPNPTIAGPSVVCTGDVATYSVTAVSGHSYLWSLGGTNGTFTSGTNAPTATIEWLTAGTETITLVQTNATGNCSATTSMLVTINQTPVQTTIAGKETVCNGSVEPYSVTNIAGQSYVWTVTGGTITSGAGTNAITVQWTAIGAQTVKVNIKTNGTNCEVDLSKNVTVEFQPAPSIVGDANVCTESEETYSTTANAGSTYAWTVTGGVFTSATTTPTVTVKWTTAGTQTLTVTETNASGNCFATATLSVVVSPTPSTTTIARVTPAGPVDHACETDTITYSTPFNSTSSYQWTVTGGTIIGSSTSNQVVINWTQQGSQTLTVVETTTGTDCETVKTQNVTVTYKPTPNINGANVACINKDHVYSTPYVAGSAYEWEITPSNVFAPIVGYPYSNSIQIKWIQPGLHTVSVTETNIAGGCSTTATMQVQVNEIPTPFINSTTGYGNPPARRPGIVCNYSTHTYTTFATPGNTFIWTITGGTIISGQYTNTVQVTWGPAGQGTLAVQETIPGSDCITTDKDTFDIRPTPTPSISGNFNPCGASTQQYTTPFVTGNSYQWVVVGGTITSGQGTNTITVAWQDPSWPNTISGSVQVTEWVTDVLPSMSCINSDTRGISVRPNPPVPTITGPSVVCATDLNDNPVTDNTVSYSTSIPAMGSNQGYISYAWSVSSNGTIVSSSTSSSVSVQWTNTTSAPTVGTITIVQTSSFGCTSTASLDVTINPVPNPRISGPAEVCLNTQGTYSTVGTAGNQYSWTVSGGNPILSGQGTANINVRWTVVGTHAIRVRETNSYGCSSTNEFMVVVHELPSVTITASGPTTFCQGGDVTLSAPIGFASYVWSNGETGRSIVVHTSGTYSVTVTDENGCSNTSNEITVNVFPSSLPIVTVSGPTTFCEGGSVTLTAPSGFSAYLWSTGETTQQIEVTKAGEYSVTVSDGNGCTGTSTVVDVFVNPKPTPILTVIGQSTICSGDSVEVRAPAGYVSYTWRSTSGENYGTGRSIWVTQSDTVYVEVVDANGCTGVSDTLMCTMSNPVPPIVASNGPNEFCDGGAVELEAPAGYASYFWSTGATTRKIVVTESGTYSVIVTNEVGCSATSPETNVVVNPTPDRPSIKRMGDTLTAVSTQAQAYQWYLDGTAIAGATEQQLLVQKTGDYRVEISDNNVCKALSDAYPVRLTDVAEDDVVAGYRADVVVFPNPTSGAFTIESKSIEAGNVHIELVNNIGEVVLSLDAVANGGHFKSNVEMGTLATGVYNVVITSGSQRWTVRLVRQ